MENDVLNVYTLFDELMSGIMASCNALREAFLV
jgi:hypothetical protein